MIPETIEFFEFYYEHPSGGYVMGWGDRGYISNLRLMKVEPVITGRSKSFEKIKGANEVQRKDNADISRAKS